MLLRRPWGRYLFEDLAFVFVKSILHLRALEALLALLRTQSAEPAEFLANRHFAIFRQGLKTLESFTQILALGGLHLLQLAEAFFEPGTAFGR